MTLQLMIDLETFGLGPSAAIVQVGAALFRFGDDDVQGQTEYTVSLQSSLLAGGRVDDDTVNKFWAKQPLKAQYSIGAIPGAAIDPPVEVVPITTALLALSNWIEQNDVECVWSHGAGFDIVILEGYYQRLGMQCPWRYSKVRDTRTLYDLAAAITGWKRPDVVVAHTAMADARQQAKDAMSAWLALQEPWRPKPSQAVQRAEPLSAEEKANLVMTFSRNLESQLGTNPSCLAIKQAVPATMDEITVQDRQAWVTTIPAESMAWEPSPQDCVDIVNDAIIRKWPERYPTWTQGEDGVWRDTGR